VEPVASFTSDDKLTSMHCHGESVSNRILQCRTGFTPSNAKAFQFHQHTDWCNVKAQINANLQIWKANSSVYSLPFLTLVANWLLFKDAIQRIEPLVPDILIYWCCRNTIQV